MIRTKTPPTSSTTPNLLPKEERMKRLLDNPFAIIRELNNRSLYHFVEFFWPEISNDEFKTNWHIPYICTELEKIAERVAHNKPKEYDLIINVPPGSTKTIICSIMFPAWCWTKWYWMRFITASYSAALSLESAEYSRDLIRSERFRALYPELEIREDKDTKSNFKVVKKQVTSPGRQPRTLQGGNRYSTSVGGTLTGFHGHILIWDDPLNPEQAVSETQLKTANHWISQTLSTRKTDKAITPTIGIMQRLHQNDPTGHILAKRKTNVKHISIPGEIKNYKEQLHPPELARHFVDNLMDVQRMPWKVLEDMEADLGQYGYAGQIGQKPTPPGGGMFKVDHFTVIDSLPAPVNFVQWVRYWDKAATEDAGAFTVGVKMVRLRNDRYIITDVRRGQWASEEREAIIRSNAEADGREVHVGIEQEPGSGGKESAQATIKNLAGFCTFADRPTGDKAYRADPYSVQVNNGNVMLLRGDWNFEFIEEHRHFPFSTYKDQVDASAGAFNRLTKKRIAGRVT